MVPDCFSEGGLASRRRLLKKGPLHRGVKGRGGWPFLPKTKGPRGPEGGDERRPRRRRENGRTRREKEVPGSLYPAFHRVKFKATTGGPGSLLLLVLFLIRRSHALPFPSPRVFRPFLLAMFSFLRPLYLYTFYLCGVVPQLDRGSLPRTGKGLFFSVLRGLRRVSRCAWVGNKLFCATFV